MRKILVFSVSEPRRGEERVKMRIFRAFFGTTNGPSIFGGLFCAVIQFSRLNLLFQDTEIEVHELLALLDRRQPLTFAVPALQRADRYIVRSSEVCLHLLLKVRK